MIGSTKHGARFAQGRAYKVCGRGANDLCWPHKTRDLMRACAHGWVLGRAESEPLETQAREEAGAHEGIREGAKDEGDRFRAMTTK